LGASCKNLAPLPARKAEKEPPSQPVITIKKDIAERLSPPSQPRPPQPDFTPEPIYQPQYPPQTIQPEPASRLSGRIPAEEIDWLGVGLGLFAVLAWGGLIPFWLMVWLSYFPPN
jgi:hypothetical protein